MTIDKMITVLLAAKDGKQIEVRNRGFDHWHSFSVDQFLWNDYRVKPEPREWSLELVDGRIIGYNFGTRGNREYVKVREVLP